MAVVLHDLLMVALAWGLAKYLRYTLFPPTDHITFATFEFPIVMLVQGAVFAWLGLYKGLWRFASLPDLWNIAKVAVIGAIGIYPALFVYDRLEGVPRSVLVLYPLILILLLALPRLLYRYWKDSRVGLLHKVADQRVVVIGAGPAGEGLIRDLRRAGKYRVVGFVDDDHALRGTHIRGIPVLGSLEQLPRLARHVAADMVLIALPAATAADMRRVVSMCERTELPFRTMPRLEDVISGRAQHNEIKEVAIEDILGRDTVQLDWTAIRECISGARVLVTGGGGSIGSELCRQVARLGAGTLTVVDVSEYNLYRIERELRQTNPDLLFHGVLAHCCDAAAISRVFADARPQIVFHAAAYKHVPLLQEQLREAFRNNVMATRTVADTAVEHAVETFVLISTDKAVNPTSVMGACKRIAEMYCQNLAERVTTRFITVRFGNVLDSVGSVVPLFREQIRQGGPVTVTHPEMSRYFMTIPEACQLILQASALGKGGEIFALDMGEPIKIRDLAEQMIRLAGKRPGADVPIIYTGLRPGEKLFEELFHPQENYSATTHAKIFLAKSRSVAWELLQTRLEKCRDAVDAFDVSALREQVSALLPAFNWNKESSTDNVIPIHQNKNEGAA
ncbi:MAG TPA: nucleoside-diphosphate sugar epimerase/dehydratase [Rhodanobacteraceae bacterium]|nr:nucleoside-diphosphate sugar epimerase/dehydratase [Rhodanobacteraceae bacterium]